MDTYLGCFVITGRLDLSVGWDVPSAVEAVGSPLSKESTFLRTDEYSLFNYGFNIYILLEVYDNWVTLPLLSFVNRKAD